MMVAQVNILIEVEITCIKQCRVTIISIAHVLKAAGKKKNLQGYSCKTKIRRGKEASMILSRQLLHLLSSDCYHDCKMYFILY